MDKEKFIAERKESFYEFLEIYKVISLKEEISDYDKRFIDGFFRNFFDAVYDQGGLDTQLRSIEILKNNKY